MDSASVQPRDLITATKRSWDREQVKCMQVGKSDVNLVAPVGRPGQVRTRSPSQLPGHTAIGTTALGLLFLRRKVANRSQVSRLLDPKDGNVTIMTLQRAAELLGRKVRLELI
jgi:hypothetical protein